MYMITMLKLISADGAFPLDSILSEKAAGPEKGKEDRQCSHGEMAVGWLSFEITALGKCKENRDSAQDAAAVPRAFCSFAGAAYLPPQSRR